MCDDGTTLIDCQSVLKAPDQFRSRFHMTGIGTVDIVRILRPCLFIYGQVDHDIQVGAPQEERFVPGGAIALRGEVP